MNDKTQDTQQPSDPGLANRLEHLADVTRETEIGVVLAAFDKAEDFGPGSKNEFIYDTACSEIPSLCGGAPVSFAVVQSEYLDIDHVRGLRLAELAKKVYPVGAIPFNQSEFVDLNQFINAVEHPLDPAEKLMSEKVRTIAAEQHGASADGALSEARKYPANAAAWINRCIADPVLFLQFVDLPGFVLPPLVRPAAGAFGVEIHKLPDPLEYETRGLAPYQRACVNRAIFDAVYPTALRPARYLNTQHVADAIPNIGPTAVVICYGFDPHSERVRRTVATTLWNTGIEIPAERIVERPVRGAWIAGAQRWCVSLQVFQAYTQRGVFR